MNVIPRTLRVRKGPRARGRWVGKLMWLPSGGVEFNVAGVFVLVMESPTSPSFGPQPRERTVLQQESFALTSGSVRAL